MKEDFSNKVLFLITIDALRSDHLKSYGYHRNTAPNLERLIQEGTTFLNAFSNGPETPSSFSAIFTSHLPFTDGGYCPLPSQKITFTQLLKENGIVTHGIHSNPNLGRYYNYDRGFNVFLDGERYKTRKYIAKKSYLKHSFSMNLKKLLNLNALINKLMYKLVGFNKIKDFLRKKIPSLTKILLPFTPIGYNAPYIINEARSFMNEKEGDQFFWLHFMDVHPPFNPPTKNLLKFRNKDIRGIERDFLNSKIHNNPKKYKITSEIVNKFKDLYDAEINYVDESLGQFFNLLKRKLKKRILLIITADHGESFYEHGYFNHQGNIFDELLKVPLFIIEIGNKMIVKKIKEMVQLIDIPVTILDYFGIDIPDDYLGKSLLPLLEGKSQDREDYVISECYQKNGAMKRNNIDGYKLISIRTQEWKFIFDEEKNKEFLFNLKIDPEEKHNCIHKDKDKLSEFRKIRNLHFHQITTSDESSKIMKAINTIKKDKLKFNL